MTGRDAFRDDPLDRFFRFVAERQHAWYRRVVLGDDPPWTTDERLRRHRFTNVYRVQSVLRRPVQTGRSVPPIPSAS